MFLRVSDLCVVQSKRQDVSQSALHLKPKQQLAAVKPMKKVSATIDPYNDKVINPMSILSLDDKLRLSAVSSKLLDQFESQAEKYNFFKGSSQVSRSYDP